MLKTASLRFRNLRIAGLDHVGCLLGDSVQCRSQVTTDLERDHGGVHDTDVAGAINGEVGINHTTKLLRQHGSCRNVVEV